MNPFANGSSSMLSQLVTSLMDSGGNGGDGDMWKGRAINFVESLMKMKKNNSKSCAIKRYGNVYRIFSK
jgi:hypothetical protein